jgi:hypothetical protein
MGRVFSKLKYPQNRTDYTRCVVAFLFALMMMAADWRDNPIEFKIITVILVTGFAMIWPFATMGRLADLHLSRLWVLPLSLSWLAVFLAMWKRNHSQITPGHISIAGLIVLALTALVLIVHSPLMLMQPRDPSKATELVCKK